MRFNTGWYQMLVLTFCSLVGHFQIIFLLVNYYLSRGQLCAQTSSHSHSRGRLDMASRPGCSGGCDIFSSRGCLSGWSISFPHDPSSLHLGLSLHHHHPHLYPYLEPVFLLYFFAIDLIDFLLFNPLTLCLTYRPYNSLNIFTKLLYHSITRWPAIWDMTTN